MTPLVAYALPFILVYLPYFAWKWSYHGYPLPNTYHAKAASKPHLGQGLEYVFIYFKCYYYLLPALVIPGLMAWRGRSRLLDADPSGTRGALLVALFSIGYLAYVVWIGRDFMFTRFCLPVTPALLLGLQPLMSSARYQKSGAPIVGLLVLASVAGEPGVRFSRFEDYLDAYLTRLGRRPADKAQVLRDLETFDRFYFDHTADAVRRDAIAGFAK